ncbi:hypothetical protein QR97_37690 [Streptomyces sp. PBH53]|nr:hypothetical protein QR97_37690 [Streptomyces sp. PBH53]
MNGDAGPATAHRGLLDVLTRTGAIAEATRQAHCRVTRVHAALDGLPSVSRPLLSTGKGIR